MDDIMQPPPPTNIIALGQDFALVASLQDEINRLRSENEHLKTLLKYGTSIQTIIDPELVIVHKQIALLEEQSMIRALTTDEAKRLRNYVEIRIMLEDRQKPKDVTPEDIDMEELTALAMEDSPKQEI